MTGLRNRACVAVFDATGERLLMVRLRFSGRDFWSLPGGRQEDRETLAEAAAREVLEETGLRVSVQRHAFDETYQHNGEDCLSRCFLGALLEGEDPVLGVDPEEQRLAPEERMLQQVAWRPVSDLADHPQVSRLLAAFAHPTPTREPVGYFRVHTPELAYATQRPRGLFVAVGKLADTGVLSASEVEEYRENRRWFEAVLPVPPFYADGNTAKAITWYKAGSAGEAMFERMGFYRRMARKYGIALFLTRTVPVPGSVIYEDEFQIGVTDSRHEGPGFESEAL